MKEKVFYRFQFKQSSTGETSGVRPAKIFGGDLFLPYDAKSPTADEAAAMPFTGRGVYGRWASGTTRCGYTNWGAYYPNGFSLWRRYTKVTMEDGDKRSAYTHKVYCADTPGVDYPNVGWVPDCEAEEFRRDHYQARDAQWYERGNLYLRRYADASGATAFELRSDECERADMVSVVLNGLTYVTERHNTFEVIDSSGDLSLAHIASRHEFVNFEGSWYRESSHVNVVGLNTGVPEGYLHRETTMENPRFQYCSRCGRWYTREAFGSHALLCSRCVSAQQRGSVITGYENRRYPSPLGSGILMYGVEAETEVESGVLREDAAWDVQQALGKDFVIIKRDGSLNNGFEIVTAPATLDEHRKHWPPLETVRKPLRSWDTTTCGMHVHISRDALSRLQLGRLVVFINAPANKDFITKVAGRYGNNYAAIQSDATLKSAPRSSGRHVAVNLSNDKTVEVRIFRGTVCPQHIIRNLEFVDALVHFCWPAERSIRDATSYAAFCEYIDQNRSRWPLFHRWLGAKGYVTAVKDTPKFKRPALEEVS